MSAEKWYGYIHIFFTQMKININIQLSVPLKFHSLIDLRKIKYYILNYILWCLPKQENNILKVKNLTIECLGFE